MGLARKLPEEIKLAMKSGDKNRLDALRSLRAAILEFEKSGSGRELSEEDEQKIALSAAKKRRDAIEQYEKAGRTELADKEKAELAVIAEFLPQQLSEAEVEDKVRSIIRESGAESARDIGKVMGAAMRELRGKADGTLVQQIAKRLLS